MKTCNLRIIKPCSVIIPIQPKIILEFFAVLKVAVIKKITGRRLGMTIASLDFHAKGIIISDEGGAGVVGHWVGLVFW